jgi:hypothetical protein
VSFETIRNLVQEAFQLCRGFGKMSGVVFRHRRLKLAVQFLIVICSWTILCETLVCEHGMHKQSGESYVAEPALQGHSVLNGSTTDEGHGESNEPSKLKALQQERLRCEA